MTPASFLLAVLGVTFALLPTSTAVTPASCVVRCGDQSGLAKCCRDFQLICTSGEEQLTGESCGGRCGEPFRRGRSCDCDPECAHYGTCCHDYQSQCGTNPPLSPNHENQQLVSPSTTSHDPKSPLTPDLYPVKSSPSRPASAAPLTNPHSGMEARQGASDLFPTLPANGAPVPSQGGPSSGNTGAQAPPSPGGPLNIQAMLSSPQGSGSSGPRSGPSFPGGLTPVHGTASPTDGPADGSTPDLCSDQPINGLTVLNNGSIMVFKGPFYWLVDPITKAAGPAGSIADDLGLPSPIDAAFTRCNCQGKTYIIKGDQYWRLSDGVVEEGYPKPLSSTFAGLTGDITAALSVPATRKRPEAIYFFKEGGKMQKFSYPTGSTPTCSSKSPRKSPNTRTAEGRLGPEINIQVSLKGLPASVTSALSVPSPKKADGYEYFLFSGPLSFTIQVSGDLPSLVKPPSKGVAGATRQTPNSASSLLNCP